MYVKYIKAEYSSDLTKQIGYSIVYIKDIEAIELQKSFSEERYDDNELALKDFALRKNGTIVKFIRW